ncbi:MAG TPA: hypothetical protein PLO78_03790 [Candidatus Omnitrophota bacterium]|nr:hypothetical protein [Candidatus Omnitrophota bacterium]
MGSVKKIFVRNAKKKFFGIIGATERESLSAEQGQEASMMIADFFDFKKQLPCFPEREDPQTLDKKISRVRILRALPDSMENGSKCQVDVLKASKGFFK